VAITVLVLVLASCVPTNAYYGVVENDMRPRLQRKFGLRELPAGSPHAEALFLGRPGMPEWVFANDYTLAAAYIFHNGPERRVWVDGRLEISTRESYARYLQITDRLVMHDPEAEKMLFADVPPDAAGRREMPAVMLQIDGFLGAIENLVNHPRWRPVFYGDAAIVFLYEPDAARLGIPAVDREKLRIDLWRRALEVMPNSANVQFKLGLALLGLQPVEAAEHFRRALEIDPRSEAARRGLALAIGKSAQQRAPERP
jgi:tetratricopeptide (TPR) repeat protein